jgi:hypothetical protein
MAIWGPYCRLLGGGAILEHRSELQSPMKKLLNDVEVRVLGSLAEKEIRTRTTIRFR